MISERAKVKLEFVLSENQGHEFYTKRKKPFTYFLDGDRTLIISSRRTPVKIPITDIEDCLEVYNLTLQELRLVCDDPTFIYGLLNDDIFRRNLSGFDEIMCYK